MSTLLSGGLLSAALLLGQASDPPTGPAKGSVPPPPTLPSASAASQPPAQRGPIISFFTREDRPVFSKITGWFKRDQPDSPPQPMTPASKGILQRDPIAAPAPAATTPTPPASNDYPRRLPNPMSKAATPGDPIAIELSKHPKDAETPKAVVQTAAQQTPANKSAKNPILAQFANKIGRDEKFEWMTGQLEMENGVYVLYYATPETVDKYHGRIVLQPQQVDMKSLHRGDLISVQGQIAQRPSMQGLTPVYRLTAANLVERPKR